MPLTHFSCCFFVFLSTLSTPQRSEALVPDGSSSSIRIGPILTGTARPIDTDQVAADALPEISVQFLPGAVEPASVRLYVNDEDVSAFARIDAQSVRWVPAKALPEGRQQVRLLAAEAQYSWSFVTATPPNVTKLEPKDTTLPSGARPTIVAQFSDIGSGIDPSRTQLTIFGGEYSDETDVTRQAQLTRSSIVFVPPRALVDGTYSVDVRVFDRAGNIGLGSSLGRFQVGGAPQFLEIQPGPDEVVLPYGTPRLIRARFNSGAYPLLQYALHVGMEQHVDAELEDHGDGSFTLSYLIPESTVGGRAAALPVHPSARSCYGVYVWNTKGLKSEESRCFSVDIERRREIEVLAPAADLVFSETVIEVRVRALENEREVEDVLINGDYAWVKQDASTKPSGYLYHYSDEVQLQPGENLIDIEVHFGKDAFERRQLRVLQSTSPVHGDLPANPHSRDSGSPEVLRKPIVLDIAGGGCEQTAAFSERQKWIEAAQQAAKRLIPDTGIEQIRLDCSGQNIIVDFLIPEQLRPRPPTLPGQQQAPAFPGADYYARVTIERTSGTVLRVFGG